MSWLAHLFRGRDATVNGSAALSAPPAAGPSTDGTVPTRSRSRGLRLTPLGLVLVVCAAALLFTPRGAVDPQVVAAVAIVLFGMVAVGAVWPMVAVRRVVVEARSPRDATVGDVVPVHVRVRRCAGGCQVRLRDPTGDWYRTRGEGAGDLEHLADRRGTFDGIRIEVRVTAPLGVVAAHRVAHVPLPAPVDVAPRPLSVTWRADLGLPEGSSAALPSPVLSGEVVRSVRPYTVGDPAHLVHWPSTARTGSLVVREMEPPVRARLAIVVDLRGLGEETEQAASFAHGLARAVLDAGGEVLLTTYDGRLQQGTSAPVRSRLDLGRRLARAALGPPGEVPGRWHVVDVRDRWWRHHAWEAHPELWQSDGEGSGKQRLDGHAPDGSAARAATP